MLSRAIPQLLWTATPEGYVDYCNEQWYAYTGLDFGQLKGQGWAGVVHPRDLPDLLEQWTRALQTGEPYQIETRLRRADGVYHWFLVRALPLQEEGGPIRQWFGTNTDIQQRKAAEEALQQRTQELATANEELTAASEEIQASADELAATNEELRAANQQLVAGEEELRRVLAQTVALNEKLTGQEKFLSGVLDQSPFATWIADRAGTAIRMNEACRLLFGLESASQSLGRYNILEDNTLIGQPFFKDIEAVFREGRIARFELAYDVRKVQLVDVPTGKPINIILTLFPVTDAQGNMTNVVVQAEDITERRQIEHSLAYQHLLIKTITDNATSGLFMMDKRGYCTFMNPAGEKMFGYTFEEIRQQPLHYMIHHHRPDGSFYPLEECPIDRALPENFDVRAHQDVFFRKDGSSFPVSCAVSPIFEGGVPVSTVIEVRDVSEEKSARAALLHANQALSRQNQDLERTNAELDRANKDLDNFVYTASHDLKSPILNIEGLLRAMERQLDDETRQQEPVAQTYALLYSSVNRFKTTIGDLTEVARISKESQEDVAALSLAEVLHEVQQDLQPQIEAARARLEADLHCGPVSFSRKNLKSLLYNLLSNAVKYRSPDREPLVRISCREETDYQVLVVEDNGLGMDMRQEDKIFALFKRLHAHVEGTGIGLYIVKKMIENAGGRIEVQSQVGVGSTFRVYFKR
jgi:PAS domain S-box-containing protein